MPIVNTDQLLAEAEKRKLAKYAEADAEFDAVVKAVELITGEPIEVIPNVVYLAKTPPTQTPAAPVRPSHTSDPIPSESAGLTDLLRWAIRRIDAEMFTTPKLIEVLAENGRDISEKRVFVASAMTKMSERGEVIKVKSGSGRVPSIFRRRRPDDPTPTPKSAAWVAHHKMEVKD